MTNEEYLAKVLQEQTLPEGGLEMAALQQHREEVETLLNEAFEEPPTIRYGGSRAKGTMIWDSYDLDITAYFPRDDEDAGGTLEEIYESVRDALADNYQVEPKGSAIRLLAPDGATYFHIDVVPGRFVDGDKGDVFLHRADGEKARLKTNLETHIRHVKNSGVIPAIRLMKLWAVRCNLGIKTFVLELLVIDLLKKQRTRTLPEQLVHVFTQFRDASDILSVEDPANPNGNDLSEALDAVRWALYQAATESLAAIENSGWPAVFGPVAEEDEAWKTVMIGRMAASATVRNQPYFGGR